MLITANAGCKERPYYMLDGLSEAAFVELTQNGFSCPIETIPRQWAVAIHIDDRERRLFEEDYLFGEIPGPDWFERRWLQRAIRKADHIVCALHGGAGRGRIAPLGGSEQREAELHALMNEIYRHRQTMLLVDTLWSKIWPWIEVLRANRRPGARLTCLGQRAPLDFPNFDGEAPR